MTRLSKVIEMVPISDMKANLSIFPVHRSLPTQLELVHIIPLNATENFNYNLEIYQSQAIDHVMPLEYPTFFLREEATSSCP